MAGGYGAWTKKNCCYGNREPRVQSPSIAIQGSYVNILIWTKLDHLATRMHSALQHLKFLGENDSMHVDQGWSYHSFFCNVAAQFGAFLNYFHCYTDGSTDMYVCTLFIESTHVVISYMINLFGGVVS